MTRPQSRDCNLSSSGSLGRHVPPLEQDSGSIDAMKTRVPQGFYFKIATTSAVTETIPIPRLVKAKTFKDFWTFPSTDSMIRN